MVKMSWKAKEASVTVKAPKIQVSPKRDMIPAILMPNRITVCLSIFSFLRLKALMVWRMTTKMTIKNITMLKRIIARIGPRNAAKKTAVSPMKQLNKREINLYESVSVTLLLLCS